MKETEQRTNVMAQESVDLRIKLESLLNEIVTTRSQLSESVANAPSSSVGISPSKPHLPLDCSCVSIQVDSRYF